MRSAYASPGSIRHCLSPGYGDGVPDKLWNMSDIIVIVEASVAKPRKRGPYKKRGV